MGIFTKKKRNAPRPLLPSKQVRRCPSTDRGDFSFDGHRLPSLYRADSLEAIS